MGNCSAPFAPGSCSAGVPACEFSHRPGASLRFTSPVARTPSGGGTPPALAGADACATSPNTYDLNSYYECFRSHSQRGGRSAVGGACCGLFERDGFQLNSTSPLKLSSCYRSV